MKSSRQTLEFDPAQPCRLLSSDQCTCHAAAVPLKASWILWACRIRFDSSSKLKQTSLFLSFHIYHIFSSFQIATDVDCSSPVLKPGTKPLIGHDPIESRRKIKMFHFIVFPIKRMDIISCLDDLIVARGISHCDASVSWSWRIRFVCLQ